MRIKKAGGKVYGADLTSAERKAMNLEINRQLAASLERQQLDVDSCILYYLKSRYGFGPKRLREFFDGFVPFYQELIDYYQLNNTDDAWYARLRLKEAGCDVEEWTKENERNGHNKGQEKP